MDSEIRDKDVTIPFVAFERVESAYERHIKRYWILCLVLLGLLVASNLAWLTFMCGFDFETHEITADGGANAYYNEVAGDVDGGVNNGSSNKSQEDDQTERSAGDDDKNTG